MMRRSTYIALALLIIISLTPPALAVDNQPRKIVTGWIPYYSIKTVLPFIKKLSTLPTPVANSPVTCEADEYSAEDIALLNSSYLFTNKTQLGAVLAQVVFPSTNAKPSKSKSIPSNEYLFTRSIIVFTIVVRISGLAK